MGGRDSVFIDHINILKMAKRKLKLRDLGRGHIRASLLRSFPFLKNKYRELMPDELNDEDVFKELFGDGAKVELFKLRAVYEFQR